MKIGLLGRKIGMTRYFTPEGKSIPVSVVEVVPNRVSQIKNEENDGYNAIQITGGTIEAGNMLREFKPDDMDQYQLGQEIKVADVFNAGEYVDVSSVSKGKGFAGAVKRHNFRTQDATHGNSLSHRAPGSIGQNQSPGRVFKGKKMAGQMGNKRCTTQSLELVSVDTERNLLLIKGAIPGAPGAKVEVKPAIKKQERGR